MRQSVAGLCLFVCLAACSSSEDEGGPNEPGDGCTRSELEADLQPARIKVPGAPETLPEPPAEGYVVSTTYLRLQHSDAAKEKFRTLNGPILTDLLARPGLIGLELAINETCNTARTKSVWASTEAMYEFVGGEAHGAAVSAVGELSRGGSVVTHWTAKTLDETSWQEAAKRLSIDRGPVY
jgi:hypothetical protein